VTEALWGSIPHAAGDPELLIVARWPKAGATDPALEADVEQVLELIRAVRNARASAAVAASARLPLTVRAPGALRSSLEAFRPAVERLARAEPLELTDGTRPSAAAGAGRVLSVVAGQLEGAIVLTEAAGGSAPGAGAGERARIEKELGQAEAALAGARARLADETFLAKAPPHIVEGARAREAELADRVAKLRASLG
jgi:valyl-tRNA synthetase